MKVDTGMGHPQKIVEIKRKRRNKPLDIILFREMMIQSLFGTVNRCAECSAPLESERKVFCNRCLED